MSDNEPVKKLSGRGGPRPGSGRPKGSANKKTQELVAKLTESGMMPLEYMLTVMRDPTASQPRRDEMAKSAAPYCHPKLANVQFTGDVKMSHENALAELE